MPATAPTHRRPLRSGRERLRTGSSPAQGGGHQGNHLAPGAASDPRQRLRKDRIEMCEKSGERKIKQSRGAIRHGINWARYIVVCGYVPEVTRMEGVQPQQVGGWAGGGVRAFLFPEHCQSVVMRVATVISEMLQCVAITSGCITVAASSRSLLVRSPRCVG
jgi:hypothetical protein